MLLHADVPSQIGSYRQWQNIGQVDNKGFELTINTVNIQKRNFTWSTSLNFNLNRNKVVSLGDVSSIPVKVAGGHITEVGRVMVDTRSVRAGDTSSTAFTSNPTSTSGAT